MSAEGLGYFILGMAALLVIAAVLVGLGVGQHPPARKPHTIRCAPWIAGPYPVIVCSDHHAWQLRGNKRYDLGPIRPEKGGIPHG